MRSPRLKRASCGLSEQRIQSRPRDIDSPRGIIGQSLQFRGCVGLQGTPKFRCAPPSMASYVGIDFGDHRTALPKIHGLHTLL